MHVVMLVQNHVKQLCGIEKDPLFKGHILHLAGLGELSKATKHLLNQ